MVTMRIKTVGSTEVDSDVREHGPTSTSHLEHQSQELSFSAEWAEEIAALPQLLPATEELEQLPAAPVLCVQSQEDFINEVSSSMAECE